MIHPAFVVKAFFTAQDSIRTVSELPANLETVLPVRQILTAGGGMVGRVLRTPRIAIHSFATSNGDSDQSPALLLASSDYDLMMFTLPGKTFAGATVSAVEVVSQPDIVPYENPALRRAVAIYQVYLRDAAPTLIIT